MKRQLIISCEHGGNEIPPRWLHLFRAAEEVLNSHEGYDAGALRIARFLAEKMGASSYCTTISRLLVDCNRSPHHPRLFSRFSRDLAQNEKREILNTCYIPYRSRVEQAVREGLRKKGSVLHLSVHTFVPRLHGKPRNAEIGLLYDPARKEEKNLSSAWRQNMKTLCPEVRVRRNYPYLGKADGLITALRKTYAAPNYLGIELEVSQKLLTEDVTPCQQSIEEILCGSFPAAVA